MKGMFAATIISALAMTSPVSAGMQGQGAHPDADKPEYKENNPGGYLERNTAKYIQEHFMSLRALHELRCTWRRLPQQRGIVSSIGMLHL
jgi:hypothetical protein